MKKSFLIAAGFLFSAFSAAPALPVADFKYVLDGGVRVAVEHGWMLTNAEVAFVEPGPELQPEKAKGAIRVRLTVAGNAVSNNGDIRVLTPARLKLGTVALSNGGFSPFLPAGKYGMTFRFSTPDGQGSVTFKVPDVPVRANSVTELFLVLQTVQVRIDSVGGNFNKLSEFGFDTYWTGERDDGGGYASYPTFFPAKTRDLIVTPSEMKGDEHGTIKAGLYDIYLDTDIGRAKYRFTVWLENVRLDPDRSYRFRVNLNAAKIEVSGGDVAPRSVHFYLPGAAQKIGNRFNKKLQVYFVEGPAAATMCPPGTYDLLMIFEDGRLEWRENVVLKSGEVTKIR